MTSRTYLSIGDVLTLLREEFPDVTISKIRFLESQGLVNPERSPSGYRKFYDHDVERLRWVLRQQREHFLPLKVIRDRLAREGDAAIAGDAGTTTDADAEEVPEEANGAGARAEEPAMAFAGRSHLSVVADPPSSPAPPPSPAPVAAAGGGAGGRPAASAPAAAAAVRPMAGGRTDPGGSDQGSRGAAPSGSAHPAHPAAAHSTGGQPAAGQGTPAPPAQGHPSHPAAGSPTPVDPGNADRGGADTGGADLSGAATGATGGSGVALPGLAGAATAQAGTTSSGAVPTEPAGPGRPGSGADRGGPAAGSPRHAARPTAEPQGTPPGPGPTGGTGSGSSASAVAATTAAPPAAPPVTGLAAAMSGASLTAEELAAATGLSETDLATLEGFGLIEPMAVAGVLYYDEEALTVAKLVADFGRYGIEPRHLRLYRNAVDREMGLIEQIVTPLLRQRNPESRGRAVEAAADLSRLGQGLRASLLRREVRRQVGG